MLTVAEIAALAFEGVQAEVADAIKAATLIEVSRTGYDHGTASPVMDQTARGSCRLVIETTKPIADVFPDYVIGAGDQLALVEGLTVIPRPTWLLRMADGDRTIQAVQDILGSGSLFYVVMR